MPTPQFISDQIGSLPDTIALALDGETIVTAESWEHIEGILSQPCSWSMRLGWGDVARGLIQKYPKGTRFDLFIGGAPQATGKLDGIGADQAEGGATTVTINGRDALAKLHDSYVDAVRSVNVATYADLVWWVLQYNDLAPQGAIDKSILQTDNNANRQIKTGVTIRAILPHRTPEQILENQGVPTVGVVNMPPQTRMNDTWHQFLRRYLDRAGLMLWAAADGSFVLGTPDGNQAATYNLVRRTGLPNQRTVDAILAGQPRTVDEIVASAPGANVVACRFKDDATHRHTSATVYGRCGGGVAGRVKVKAVAVDSEMVDAGYAGQGVVYRDAQVHSAAEARFFAMRKLAEERRAGWSLEYTIAGLTLPFAGDGAERAVIVPDTVVNVQDDELGISGPHYIETVIRRRSRQTQTTIRLMRPDDLIFGADE